MHYLWGSLCWYGHCVLVGQKKKKEKAKMVNQKEVICVIKMRWKTCDEFHIRKADQLIQNQYITKQKIASKNVAT